MAKKDYEIGYGKPPRKTQFQKGRSGNPKGRPKGSMNYATRFTKVANTNVPVNQNGKSKKVMYFDLMVEQLAAKAASGNLQAIQLFIRWVHVFEASGTELFDDHEFDSLARAFLRDVQQRQQQERSTRPNSNRKMRRRYQSMSSHSTDVSPLYIDGRLALRKDFKTFARFTFSQLNPQSDFVDSSYLSLLAAKVEACVEGRCKRLMICVPPRSLKSIMVSVALPAWLLGLQPHRQIICASYGQELSDKHARDTRAVMLSPGYRHIFNTRLSPNRLSVNDFMTTEGGFRMATSVGGVLTGRGGDFLIIDDPLKPDDAYSDTQRSAVNRWFESTLLSRLNNKQDGVIIVVMQRLHQDDLVGHLLEKGGWELLKLPAIAEEEERLEAETWCGTVRFHRRAGEVLDASRSPKHVLEQTRREVGSYLFDAQYQQNPQPEGGAIIKTNWLCRYLPHELPQQFSHKLQSWDTANKSGELNDFSVCTTWGVLSKNFYLLDVFRKRVEYPELKRAVEEQFRRFYPRRVLVEDKGSGTQILQDLKRSGMNLTPYCPPTGHDKQMRLVAQSAVFEGGRVFLPASAPWLDEYVREVTGFPGTRHDDQVDSTTQALDHLTRSHGGGFQILELQM